MPSHSTPFTTPIPTTRPQVLGCGGLGGGNLKGSRHMMTFIIITTPNPTTTTATQHTDPHHTSRYARSEHAAKT